MTTLLPLAYPRTPEWGITPNGSYLKQCEKTTKIPKQTPYSGGYFMHSFSDFFSP